MKTYFITKIQMAFKFSKHDNSITENCFLDNLSWVIYLKEDQAKAMHSCGCLSSL